MECQHEFRFHQASAGSPEAATPVFLRQWLLDGSLPKRVAWAAAVTISCLILALKLFLFSDSHLHAVQRWAARPWAAANCSVLASGISYLGDCEVGRREPAHDYADCRPAALDGCQGAVRANSGITRRLGSMHLGEGRSFTQEGPHRSDGVADGKCIDAFLPWALLTAGGGAERCGYLKGLPRESRVWTWREASLELELIAGTSVPCWLLDITTPDGGHDCRAVALMAPSTWPERAPMKAWREWARPALTFLALAFLAAGVAAAISHGWCRVAVLGTCVAQQRSEEGGGTARDVRKSLGFRAGVAAEYRRVPVAAEADALRPMCMEVG